MNAENITIYVTTLIRYKEYGYIYKVDFPHGVKNKITVRNRTSVAKHGGPHGLAWLDDVLVTGTYDDIRFYDQDLTLQSSFSHPFLSGVHGISVDADHVWVSSCNNEAVICFDRSGNVQDLHFLVEHEDLMERVGRRPIAVDRSIDFREKREPYDQQPFHVNDVQATAGGLEVSLHKLGMVYNLHQNKPVARIPSTDIHDGRSHGTKAFINDTGAQRVVKLSINGGQPSIEGQGHVDVMQNAALSTRLSIVAQKALLRIMRDVSKMLPRRMMPAYNCRPNWLRGLHVVDDKHVLVGTSPAAVALVDLEREEVVDYCQLSDRLCEAVFAIVPADPSERSLRRRTTRDAETLTEDG